jgi:flagellar basal-body rod protein FlgG
MIRGLYTSISGLVAAMTRQSIVADNLANVNTVGFHQSNSTTADFEVALAQSSGANLGYLGTGTFATGLTLDRSQGPIESTDGPADLAIEGDGLFVVATPGGLAGTRAGNFSIDAAGTLVTANGYPVLDTAGKPIVASGTFTVGPDGTVAGTGQKIALAGWPAGGTTRLGQTLVDLGGTITPAGGTIRQGSLEHSNTDVTTAMTELVSLQRQFSLSSRAITIQDETLGDAAQLGRLK